MELDYFKPVLNHGNVAIAGGTLAASGSFEYGSTVRIADLKRRDGKQREDRVRPDAADGGCTPEGRRARPPRRPSEVNNAPDLQLRARQVDVVDSRVGFVNKRTTPAYRAFIDVARLRVDNFTNQRTEGEMVATLTGRFMGNGPDAGRRAFPRRRSTGRTSTCAWRSTRPNLTTMNDMLRAHGKFDVVAGEFSFYSELDGEEQRRSAGT